MGVKTLVSTVTVGAGGAASIQFTSIPQTGTDLLLVISARTTKTGNVQDDFQLRINGDSASSYGRKWLRGNGSSADSVGSAYTGYVAGGYYPANDATANTFGNISVYIPNYAGSAQKSISIDGVTEHNNTTAYSVLSANSWPSTSAVTSLLINAFTGNLVQYSTASLYLITKGSGGATVS